jgi:hypothetical protein
MMESGGHDGQSGSYFTKIEARIVRKVRARIITAEQITCEQ